MKQDVRFKGNMAALVTILIWGTTFIATKLLLRDFSPIEILFLRFVLGYGALWMVCPRLLKLRSAVHRMYLVVAGLTGIAWYFLLENIALTYTLAANVGVIICIAPLFTAVLVRLLQKGEALGGKFFLGFGMAMLGIYFIIFGGQQAVQIHPFGDLLAVGASLVWAVYAMLTKKISTFGYPIIQTTRASFFYGLCFILPVFMLSDLRLAPERFADGANLFNLLFLGLGASALCFVTWNYAVKILGTVETSLYIYLVPMITVITAVIVLQEILTGYAVLGSVLTLLGLFISEKRDIKAFFRDAVWRSLEK